MLSRQLYRRIILNILIFSVLAAYSQQHHTVFHHVSDGLSQNTVTSFAQDKYGFLWVGTHYGLNRFDGVNFKTFEYDYKDSLSLRTNLIDCLLADGEGNLWVGTYGGGLNRYDIDKNEFIRFTGSNKHETYHDDYITDLHRDENDNIWVGTEKGGLFILELKTGNYHQFFHPQTDNRDVVMNDISVIDQDQFGNIWVGTFSEGLYRIEKGSGKILQINELDASFQLNHNVIRSLHRGKKGTLWVGTNRGIAELVYDSDNRFHFSFEYSKGTTSWKDLQSSVILSIVEQENVLWVGTENNGLFRVDLITGELTLFKSSPIDEKSISGNSIWTLFEDRDNTIWAGTYLKGISKIDPLEQKFSQTNQVMIDEKLHEFSLTSSFVEDKHGNLWIGSDGEGLFYWDKKENEYKQYGSHGPNPAISSDIIVALMIDRKENLWVGTWNGGINMLPKDGDNFDQWQLKKNGGEDPSNFDIYEFMEDRKGRIWISTFREGVKIYLPDRDEFVSLGVSHPKWKLGKGKIRSMIEDRDGNIWIGTEVNGLRKLTVNDDLEIIDAKTYFPEGMKEFAVVMINDMFLDSKNKLWVATSGNGLLQIDTRTDSIRRFSKAEGLPSNMIYAMLEDDKGKVWASTNAGIFSLDMQTHEVNTFTESDGLQSNAFCKSSSLKAKDGTLYFGGIKGFNAFKPDNLSTNPKIPEVYITKLEVGDNLYPFEESAQSKSIFNGQKVDLKHHENDFTFQFIAINYLQSAKNQYQYKLENYDESWRSVGTDKLAQYTNVPPGNYVFNVKASNNDGLWNEEGAQMMIHISKPWYQTYLAYFFYLCMLAGLLIWGRRNIIARERLRGELQVEQVEHARVEEVNQIKTRFFANISHEFKTPLTLIMSPLQVLINQVGTQTEEGKLYDIMRRNAERLYRLINQILDLSMMDAGQIKLQASENDLTSFLKQIVTNFSSYADECFINFEIDIQDPEIPLYFDKDKLEKVFVNILSNAFKFTPAHGKIGVSLTEKEDQVIIHISDTGKGINPEEQELIFERFYKSQQAIASSGTGIGLSLCKQFVEMHKGEITLYSKPNQSTLFTITLQKGREHLNEDEILQKEIPLNYSTESVITLNSLYDGVPEETEEMLAQKQLATKDEKAIILIVEDNEDLASFIASLLQEKYSVLQAKDGAEGYQMAQEHIPDLIITDVMMPEMNGYELSKKVKENTLTSHIFIIMLSVKASEKNLEEGFSLGVDSYLSKPFNPKLLDLRIQNLLSSRHRFKQQIINKQSVKLEPSQIPFSKLDEQFLKKTIKMIEENMADSQFKVEDLCKVLGTSKSQLYRKLKGLVGQSPNEFMRMIRFKRAAQLLRQTDMRIAEITYKVGFNDLQYFRAAFKKQYGMSPSQYKENLQSNSSVETDKIVSNK